MADVSPMSDMSRMSIDRPHRRFNPLTGDWILVWSGTTESMNPSSSVDVNAEIAKLIVPELLAQGVIAR